MNQVFESGFNAGLVRAKELVLSFPALEHGNLPKSPHEAAQQVIREIAASLDQIIAIKFVGRSL